MELKDITHLPDDVLNLIFLYMTNPLTDALKQKAKAIHFLEDDADDPRSYILYKSVYQCKEVVLKGFWSDLFKCEFKQMNFIKDIYSPYEYNRYGRLMHQNEPYRWIRRLQCLKYKTNKDLKQIITNNKIEGRSKAKTKKQMIQLIIKYK